MPALSTVLDPARSAHASIEGYLYQAYLGVERWLELKEGEVLRCEGDEDLDRLLIDGSGGISEQVKSLNGDINIRDEVVQETLRRFVVSQHRLLAANPADRRKFVFTTTATLRRQRTDSRAPIDVLESWELAKTDEATRLQVVDTLRNLLPLPEPDEDHPGRRLLWQQIRDALAWLDGERRWADLIGWIEWRLGEPGLSKVRERVGEKLHALRPGVPPNLEFRLLDEILLASTEKEPINRVRTRQDLVTILDQAGTQLETWLATFRGHRLVERIHELDRLRGILHDKHLDLRSSLRPSQLLTAEYEVIPFEEAGRTEILDDLAIWCAGSRRALVRLIYGDGGLGKTRLLMEWCRRLAAQGWLTGFLQPTATEDEMALLLQGTLPRLVVIDYAETQLDRVRFLVSRLARAKDGPKLRLVLLARREADWWRTLETDAATRDLLETTWPQELRGLLTGVEERRKAFQSAADAFALRLGEALPQPLGEPNLEEAAFGRPLYLHMAALAAVQGMQIHGAEEALTETLARERRYWEKEVDDLDVDAEVRVELKDALERAVAVLTLLGGMEAESRTKELATRLLPGASSARTTILTMMVHHLYAALDDSGRYVSGLEPDLLGEELVCEALGRESTVLLQVALGIADAQGYRQLLTVIGRLAQRRDKTEAAEVWLRKAYTAPAYLEDWAGIALEVAVVIGDPVGKVLAPVIEEHASPELAEKLLARCNQPDLAGSVYLREVALAAARDAYQLAQTRLPRRNRLFALWRWFFPKEEDIEAQSKFAERARDLSSRLADLNLPEEAIGPIQQAVKIRRWLARRRPDQFLFDLAVALDSRGNALGRLQTSENSIQDHQEALHIFRRLSQKDTSLKILHNIAAVLGNLGVSWSALGRPEIALQVSLEAVEVYRQVADCGSQDSLASLAAGLTNLGAQLWDLGHYREAITTTQEAVDIRRNLARERPDAFLPELALSLKNLSVQLSAQSLTLEAQEPARESVAIYREFAKQRPRIFLLYFAESLSSLGSRLREAGQHQEALDATEEAIRIQRDLAHEQSEVSLYDLARSLNNASIHLGGLGRHEESLSRIKESVEIYRQLSSSLPDRYLPSLAHSLQTLCSRLVSLKRYTRAAEAARESVDILRPFADQAPEKHLPSLAGSLQNLGRALRGMKYLNEALSATQESVDLWRQICSQSEKAHGPELAGSLMELGATLRPLGRRTDALAANNEATNLFRRLVHDNPALEPRLASALNDLSIALRVTGRAQEALQAAVEGIQLLTPLLLSLPEAYLMRMQDLVQTYLNACRQAGHEPDLELLGPIEAVSTDLERPSDNEDGETSEGRS